MAIITISRELAALGDETAQELAKLLDYRLVDKQALEDKIKSYGFSRYKFEKYDERKPSFFAALSQDKDAYLHYLKKAMLEEAAAGNCMFVGRGANAVFKDVPGVLSVFLVSPFEIRLERVKSYFHCDDKRARQILEQSDSNRKGFLHYFFDMEWNEAANYHMTVNTGYLHPASAAQLVRAVRDEIIRPEHEARSLARIKEMSQAEEIIQYILYAKKIPIYFLEVAVHEGEALLYGVASSQAIIEAAAAAARELGLVAQVRPEIQVVQEYPMMP